MLHQQSTSCELCSSENEDLEHCLLQCPWVNVIWNEVKRCCHQIPRFDSLVQLIEFNSQSSNSDSSKSFVSYTAWSIWNARNNYIFQSVHHDPLKITALSQRLTTEFIEASMASNSTTMDVQSWGIGNSMSSTVSSPRLVF